MKIQQVVKACRIRQGDLVADEMGWLVVIEANIDPCNRVFMQLTFAPDVSVSVRANMRVIVLREVS